MKNDEQDNWCEMTILKRQRNSFEHFLSLLRILSSKNSLIEIIARFEELKKPGRVG